MIHTSFYCNFQTATPSLPWSLPKLNGITSKTQRYHFPNSTASLPESLPNQSHQFQNSTTSLPWSLPKLIAITSKTQRHHFQNSTVSESARRKLRGANPRKQPP